MFISYKISQQIAITPEEYKIGISKATKLKVFNKYLYKICFNGICIKINRIEIIDNLLLRKDAEILVILELELVVLKLVENEYFQGTVQQYNENGIIVKFCNGLLQGRILPEFLHERSLYNYSFQKQSQQVQAQKDIAQNEKQKQLQGQWILPFDQKKAFTWKLGQKVRFKVQSTRWQKQSQTRFADIIFLKADEQGLGPVSWWI